MNIPTILLLALSVAVTFAADPVDYEKSVAFVQERSLVSTPPEKAVYSLGPEQLDEFYFENDKEQKRVARKARIFNVASVRNVGGLISQASISQNDLHEVLVYRRGDKNPVVRVVGNGGQLQDCQFGLKTGDLIIIQRPAAAK